MGQVTNINTDENLIEVNGQNLILDSQSLVESQLGNFNGITGLKYLSIGDHVAVTGDLMDPGVSLASEVIVFEAPYVAGSSESFARVVISSFDTERATVSSGKTQVNLSNIANTGFTAGEEIEAFGSAFDESFVAQSITIPSDSNSETSGLVKIRASGSRKIRASGSRKIRASGSRKIRASGSR
ncbi:MAG: hypothetical protein ACR2QW_12015 [bacterium]